MILDLRAFDQFPAAAEVRGGKDEFQGFLPDVTGVDEVWLRVTVHKSGQEFICHGKVAAKVRMECSRCLREFGASLESPTEFIVKSDSLPPNPQGIPDDQDYVYMHGQNLVADPSDVVRQALILSVDMKPLCTPECKGLCQTCGANLNEGPCGCRTERVDERWSALRGLRDNHA